MGDDEQAGTAAGAGTGGRARVGLILPTLEGTRAGGPRWGDYVGDARRAEARGFDALWLPDHLLFSGPGLAPAGETRGSWDCWTLLPALAAATGRIALGTLVTCTGYRHPALLARAADTLEEVSGGRLVLGVGAGWHEPEFRAFGHPFDHRVGRFAEAVAILDELLRRGRTDFAGRYYQAPGAELRPRGPRPAGPPLLIGALDHAPRMLDLVARYADLWNVSFGPAGRLPALQGAVDRACVARGRDPRTLGRTACVAVHLDRPAGGSGTLADPLGGTVDELATALGGYLDAGIAELQVRVFPDPFGDIDRFAAVRDRLLARGA